MKKLGKYLIEEQIGKGGFGEVFKGFDPLIKRPVAVKTCNADDKETRDRFSHEAQIAGNLHHRNVTTVYDFGIEDSVPYLIQEYLSGEDLDRKIKRRDFLPYPEKLYYLLQIARGLAYAHSQGVIHRDIKPGNIRILGDGTAKIMDFGIAKLARQETGLTQKGTALGTASYLAPEQLKGESVNHRTDVFSYGVLAYELLAYERPFNGRDYNTVFFQILNTDPIPIAQHWPQAPAAIVRVIDRCLAKDPKARYADAGELLRDLERLQKEGRARRQKLEEQSSSDFATAGAMAQPKSPPPPGGDRSNDSKSLLDTAGRPRTLEEIELAVSSDHHQLSPPIAASGTITVSDSTAHRNRPSPVGRIVVVVIAVIAAVGGGWYLGNGGRTDVSDPGDATIAQEPTATTGNGQSGANGAEALAGRENPTIEDVTPPPNPQPVVRDTPPPPPPPPTRPDPGTLVFDPPGWTRLLTVEVEGVNRPLNRRWDIELPPGRHTVNFGSDIPGYSIRRSVEVSLRAGQRHSVTCPILQPSGLTVRSLPGRSQGQVWIGSELIGQTPLRRKLRAPGTLLLEIRPWDGGAPLVRNITLTSGMETILTFDLDAGSIDLSTKPLAL